MSIQRPAHFLSVKLPILDMGEVADEEQESVHARNRRLAGESVEIPDELRIIKMLGDSLALHTQVREPNQPVRVSSPEADAAETAIASAPDGTLYVV